MPERVSRREFLGLAAAGFLGGWLTANSGSSEVVGGLVGGDDVDTVATPDGSLVFAADYAAAAEIAADAEASTTIAWTALGNQWVWGSGTITMPDTTLTIKTGAAGYDEAQSMVDTFPTIVITTRGNQYTFLEN